MAEGSEGVPSVGIGTVVFSQGSAGDSKEDLPDFRRSMRKKPMRSPSLRSRRAKSSPKSPLMRMAEMRKGGLRGRALRQSGKKGLDGCDSLEGKGKKGCGGRGASVLEVIPESDENGEGSLGGLGLEGCGGGGYGEGSLGVSGEGEVSAGDGFGEGVMEDAVGRVGEVGEDGGSGSLIVEMVEDRSNVVLVSLPAPVRVLGGAEESRAGCAGQLEVIPAGLQSDLALDLISAQPLQEMEFIGEQVVHVVDGKGGRIV